MRAIVCRPNLGGKCAFFLHDGYKTKLGGDQVCILLFIDLVLLGERIFMIVFNKFNINFNIFYNSYALNLILKRNN